MDSGITHSVLFAGATTVVTNWMDTLTAGAPLGAMGMKAIEELFQATVSPQGNFPLLAKGQIEANKKGLATLLKGELKISKEQDINNVVDAVYKVFLSSAITNADILQAEIKSENIQDCLDWDSVIIRYNLQEPAKICAKRIIESVLKKPDIFVLLLPNFVPDFIEAIRDLKKGQDNRNTQVQMLQTEVGFLHQRLEMIGQPDKNCLQQYQRNLAKGFELETAVRPPDCHNPLSRLYVPLPILTQPSPTSLDDDEKDKNLMLMRGDRRVEKQEEQFNSMVKWLFDSKTAPGNILLGDPGSGKSTELRYLFCQIVYDKNIVKKTQGKLKSDTYRECYPIYLRLPVIAKILQQQENDVLLDFWQVLEQAVLRDQPGDSNVNVSAKKVLARLITQAYEKKKNHLLILLDGFDEVSGERGEHVDTKKEEKKLSISIRTRLQDWIKRCYGQTYTQGVRWLVTARTYAYKDIDLGSFRFVSLGPYSDPLKICYIRNHCSLFGKSKLAEKFINFLQEPGIKRFNAMLSRPLLLAYACELVMDDKDYEDISSLPTDRAGLLNATIAALLQRWPEKREHMASDFFMALREQAKIPLFLSALQRLAWEQFQTSDQNEDQAPEISREALNSVLKILVEELDTLDAQYTAEHLIEYLERQSGLLIARGSGHFAFAHLNLHEYLAACYCVNYPNKSKDRNFQAFFDTPANIVENFQENPKHWREVLALAVGEHLRLGHPIEGERLLERVMPLRITQHFGDASISEAAEQAAETTLQEFGAQLSLASDWPWRKSFGEELSDFTFDPLQTTPLEQRAIAGRILGWLGDTRLGVGLDDSGLPGIDWVDIVAPNVASRLDTKAGDNEGQLVVDAKGPPKLNYAYQIARYPVTWSQYQCFVDDPGGYHNNEWWGGMSCDVVERQLRAALWPIPNHPRDSVNWYQCVAFCRWLTQRKGANGSLTGGSCISLPTGWEWQFAATGGDSSAFLYPWGPKYSAGYANTKENTDEAGPHNLKQTTAVGLYPKGATSHDKAPGIMDFAGNVWEWCLNRVFSEEVGDMTLSSTSHRALHGGSWNDGPVLASSVFRDWANPYGRDGGGRGFRLVCVPSNHRNSET